VLLVAEPGRFQVQPALQPQAGGLADGPVVVQPGEFGVLGGVRGPAQVPVAQAARLRRLAAADPGAGPPDPGLQARPGPIDRVISGPGTWPVRGQAASAGVFFPALTAR